MRKRYKYLLAGGTLLLCGKLVVGWWNPDELVTFHGKEVPVTEALRSFSSQTRRTILFPPTLEQKVTLDLDRVPLEDALEAVSDQAELAHSRIFVLTANGGQRKSLLETLSSQTEQPPLMQMARMNRWQTGLDRKPGLISYQAEGKPADTAVAEINFATDSYFYVLGAATEPLTIHWKDLPVREAATQLASLTGTDEERIYQFFPRRRNAEGRGEGRRARAEPADFIQEWTERVTRQIEKLPPAEKAAAEAQWAVQQERMKEFAAMTDEQRMERMMQRFTSGNQEERLIRRLKNSTPESRAKRYQRYESRRAARGDATPTPATPKPATP